MLDFFTISTRSKRPGYIEVYPIFLVKHVNDVMFRGGDFYAVWVESRGLWSTDEQDVVQLVDSELNKYVDEHKNEIDGNIKIVYMTDASTGIIDAWHKYCQKQMRDSYHTLDEKLLFANDGTNKKDYASKRLDYPLEPGECPAYEKIISTLYSEEERHKLEWAIGSIVTGDSKTLQKFLVLYGGPGTGKSTILNIIQKLFEGYHATFDAKALGSANAQFALEPFKKNPLVAIQHDGDLSKIEDNTRLNSVVSHEWMNVNEKHKSQYENRFVCFLFMGTNKPVKITDSKSGILRRLIDVSPTGNKIPAKEYTKLMNQVQFELGPIAYHCKNVYLSDPGKYDNYIPTSMMSASNDFYNFMVDSYSVFKRDDGTTLKAAWEMYKVYTDEAKVPYPLTKMIFRTELMSYFKEFHERFVNDNGDRIRSYYNGFLINKFEVEEDIQPKKQEENKLNIVETLHTIPEWLQLKTQDSIFDKECADCLAQKASSKETPSRKWDDVKSTLSKIDTSKLHYVKVPENHIVIDFDIRDKTGLKSFQKNLEAAEKWPPTYAELSKSGAGIHLHYIYTGDVSKLSRVYDDDIEVKVFTGKSSLRRMLTKCNDIPIATISSGLPLKGDNKNLLNWDGIKNEKMLRTMIKRNLNKEYHAATKPSIDYIAKLLYDAYSSGIGYDVSDMKNEIFAFAAGSTHQADYCIKLANKMKFKSEDPNPPSETSDDELIFYDCEVFPNLFLVNWKIAGEGKPVVRMINPKPHEIENLLKFNLVGFNCRRYDNHMLYACLMGYSNEQLYNLSQKIVGAKKGSIGTFFGEAYNISYTDVYDFCSKKQSLKKWEIELGIHHQELGLPWDKPVPEDMWEKVAAYCDNDVYATEAVFNKRQADFVARKIQVDLVKLLHGVTDVCVNDTTNTLSTKIIFGNNRKPQSVFNYRDMSKPVGSDQYDEYREKFGPDYIFRVFDDHGLPQYRDYIPGEKLPDGWSILPFFLGYKFDHGKSTFMGEEIGEGGRVYSEPGIYANVWDGDVASQHPHSAIFECIFGPEFTKRFQDIVDARVAIKHKDFDATGKMLNGALKPYLNDEQAKDLAQALKIIINSIYGLTSAAFENPFRDTRNIDNIVAKRGALFMTLLKSEVQKLGYTVAHIKTDSIKIPNATKEIIDFVTKFGKEFGYKFETEAEFDRYCLVNDAVYIAKFKAPEIDKDTGEEIWWTATGTQFAVPYVFKKLFSKKSIEFEDMCETKAVSSALYLDMNEKLANVETEELVKSIRSKLSTVNQSLTNRERDILEQWKNVTNDELDKMISEGHDYHFVGKIGQFCPIKSGCGGGELVRESTDKEGNVKYTSATGAKGYRWLESESVRLLEKQNDIDRSYYDSLVNAAIETISEYGDFERFVADEPYTPIAGIDFPPDEDLPWYNDEEMKKLKTQDTDLPYYFSQECELFDKR